MKVDFQWVEFYTELASELLKYKNKRTELLGIMKEIYADAEMKFPFIEKNNEAYEDICPFTVFATFNKQIKDSNRIALLKQFAKQFSIDSPVPNSFNGVPVVMNLNAWFFAYKARRENGDIENLWNLFEKAIAYGDYESEENRKNFIFAYDRVSKQKFIKWNITMGLFWIRPQSFINLDSVNRAFLTNSDKMPSYFTSIFSKINEGLPDGESYLLMCEEAKRTLSRQDLKYRSFPELSYVAFEGDQQSDMTGNNLPTLDSDAQETGYWIYSPGENASMWDEFYKLGIMGIGWDELSDLKKFNSKEEIKGYMRQIYNPSYSYINSGHCLWQFANEMNVGDIVFAKKGMHTIIGKGEVVSDYIYDDERASYKHIRKVKWLAKGEWNAPNQAAMKTLTCISSYPDYVKQLLNLFAEDLKEEANEEKAIKYPPYTRDDFLDEVFMSADTYASLEGLLILKQNVILQGAPGVGKTFVAKRLAYSIMGEKDTSRVAMVQFHQSYSYEDFIQGYRPTKGGFELANGSFYRFCKKAEEDSERPYFFIIDEINRGNLSKILGELMMLLEKDKRGERIKMLYSNEWFSVPKNVYIIGTMNTADRSLAFMDYALRRRFAFFDFGPAFLSEGFQNYLEEKNAPKLNQLISVVETLNDAIAMDESLGEGFCIGHSYFCSHQDITDGWLQSVVDYEIVPLLKEYWFDEPSKVRDWAANLRNAIK